jgi:predicted acetyltransferase
VFYQFNLMNIEDPNEEFGYIQFNSEISDDTQVWYGNIGYRIYEQFRGKKLAQRAVKILFKFI